MHADTVLRVCTLYLHGHPERDDAFQDTFMAYAQSNKEFEDDEHRKAWLVTVARNACRDLLRRAETRFVSLDEAGEDPAADDDPSTDAERQEESEALVRALNKLAEPYRIVLYLMYYENYKASEIAEMLGVPENTVYTRLARGREKLKEVLAYERGRAATQR